MIATNDLKTILFNDFKTSKAGKQVKQKDYDVHEPVEKGKATERVVIVINATTNEDWQKTYGYVCIYVPRQYIPEKKYYRPHKERLTEIERLCADFYKHRRFTTFRGETVYYEMEGITQETDEDTWSDYISVRLKITNSNFKL